MQLRSPTRRLMPTLLKVLALLVTLLPLAAPRVLAQSPDACEPGNDLPARACPLSLDVTHGPYTIAPAGDIDYYRLTVGEQRDGLATTITVRATDGLDMVTTITRADTGERLGLIASPAISITLEPDLVGQVLLRIESRRPAPAAHERYWIETRRGLPPTPRIPSGPEGRRPTRAAPDALENNYNPDTAAPIGVNAVYDLTFACPVEGGCPGGDHDFLRAQVKAGVRYLIATFDLEPGVDTVLDIFWDDANQPWITGNDDVNPLVAFHSAVDWTAPSDGTILIRLAPRTGGLDPMVIGDEAGNRYRFALMLANSIPGAELRARVEAQAGIAAPPPTPTVTPPEPAPLEPTSPQTEPVVVEAAALPEPTAIAIEHTAQEGMAFVLTETPVLIEPRQGSASLGTLPIDATVTLTGRVAGIFIEVTGDSFVGAGWVDRRDLRRTTPVGPASPGPAGSSEDGALPPVVTPAPGSPASEAGSPWAVTISRRTVPVQASSLPVLPQVEVIVRATISAGERPLPGMRVQLLTALGDLLTVSETDSGGNVMLTSVVPQGSALLLCVPALGLQRRIADPAQTQTIMLPAPKGGR